MLHAMLPRWMEQSKDRRGEGDGGLDTVLCRLLTPSPPHTPLLKCAWLRGAHGHAQRGHVLRQRDGHYVYGHNGHNESMHASGDVHRTETHPCPSPTCRDTHQALCLPMQVGAQLCTHICRCAMHVARHVALQRHIGARMKRHVYTCRSVHDRHTHPSAEACPCPRTRRIRSHIRACNKVICVFASVLNRIIQP